MRSHPALTCRKFAAALEAAGVISDLDTIERIIIDVDPAKMVTIHVQRVGDERLLEIAAVLAGAQITERPRAVRYWARIHDDLIADGKAAWPAGVRPVRPDDSGPPGAGVRWWLMEDDDAPADLDGKRVELVVGRGQNAEDAPYVTHIERRVV
jgi:hypothetical protein